MRINDLVRQLEKIKNLKGNIEIYLSSDSEGNSYGTTADGSVYWDDDKVVLFPWKENIDLNLGD